MPQFFFHVHDDLNAFDEEGMELPHINAAHERALVEARLLAAEQAKSGRINLGHYIVVTDDQGATVTTVLFREAVVIEGQQ